MSTQLTISQHALDQHLIHYAQSTQEIAQRYSKLGKWDAAFKLTEAALELELPSIQKGRLLNILGHLLERRMDYARSEAVLNQAHKIAESESDEWLLADVLYNLGELEYFGSSIKQDRDHHAALQIHEQVLEIRQRIGDQAGGCFSLSRLGTIHERVGDMETALDYFQRSQALGEKIDFEIGIWRPLVHIAFNTFTSGDQESGLQMMTQAYDITHRYQITDGLVYTLVNVPYLQFLMDRDVRKAIEACRAGLELGKKIGFHGGVARTLFVMAMIATEGGETELAHDYWQQTADISRQYGFKRFLTPAEEKLAELKKEL